MKRITLPMLDLLAAWGTESALVLFAMILLWHGHYSDGLLALIAKSLWSIDARVTR